MDANVLIARIDQLQKAIEESGAQHNALVGRLLEAKDLLQNMADKPLEDKQEYVIADEAICNAGDEPQ